MTAKTLDPCPICGTFFDASEGNLVCTACSGTLATDFAVDDLLRSLDRLDQLGPELLLSRKRLLQIAETRLKNILSNLQPL